MARLSASPQSGGMGVGGGQTPAVFVASGPWSCCCTMLEAQSGPLRHQVAPEVGHPTREQGWPLYGAPIEREAIPPPSNAPPFFLPGPSRKVQLNRQPIRRLSRASSSLRMLAASRCVLSSVSTRSTNRPNVLPRSSNARTCVPSVSPSRSAICSSF